MKHASRQLWLSMRGLAIWAACFLALYVVHALACRYGFAAPPQQASLAGALKWLLVLIWLACTATLAWLTWRSWIARANRFLGKLTLTLDASGLFATIVTGLPMLWIPACML